MLNSFSFKTVIFFMPMIVLISFCKPVGGEINGILFWWGEVNPALSSGTLELLLTLPIRTIDAVIGKFLAGWIFIAFSLLLTFPIVFTVVYLGSPDYGLMLTGYLSSLLLAGCYLVVSSTTSAMTQNQVISFVISAMINFLLLLLGWGVFQKTITNLFSTSTSDLISFISYTNHYETISKGLIDSRSLVYFFSFIGFFLYLNSLILEKKK